MRRSPYESGWSATVILLVTNAVVFVVTAILAHHFEAPIGEYFALSLNGLKRGFVWQLLTFQFLHGGWVHLLLNSWGIYVFGKAIEESLGPVSFLRVYFTSGVLGGLFQVLLTAVVYGPNSIEATIGVVGASAGLFGLIGAFGALFPHRQLTLLLFFVLPVTITARWLLIASAGLAVFGILVPTDNVAHAAHLGGLLTGLAYVLWVVRSDWNWPSWKPFRSARPQELVSASSKRSIWQAKSAAVEDLPPAEFISREVDPILDKISAHGIHSLTERERKVLEAARNKMAKR